MFGKDNNQQQPANDFSGVSLPAQNAPTPQFATPAPDFVAPSMPTAPLQDLSVPELSAQTIETTSLPTQTWESSSPAPQTSASADDLTGLKQQALSQLSPLVGKLDQTPEEKFRTTMMMIQASDDQSLLKSAYDAAQQITDEKVKAQALLDVINEINYFTQKSGSNQN